MPRTVLLLHSSAGLYGADVQLLAIVRGLDPQRWRAVCVLPEPGRLVALLEQAGAEVVVHPLAVLRRALATPAGAVGLARALRRDGHVLGALARGHRAAVVHDNTSVVLSGAAVARAAGAAHVTHVREIWASGGRVERALWPLMSRRLLRADALVGISAAVCAQFPRRGGHPAARRAPARARPPGPRPGAARARPARGSLHGGSGGQAA